MVNIVFNPVSTLSRFQEFFSFHGLASGLELFVVNEYPWPFLFSGVSFFPEVRIVVFS